MTIVIEFELVALNEYFKAVPGGWGLTDIVILFSFGFMGLKIIDFTSIIYPKEAEVDSPWN